MNIRSIATPLTIAAFLAVGITGLCMVFDLKGGYMENFHELAGILMVIAAGLHAWVNRAMLAKHLRSWTGAVLAAVAAVLVIVAVVGPGKKASEDRGGLARRMVQTAIGAELKRVAILAGKTPSQVVTELRAKGLVVESEQITIRELAKRNHRSEFSILDLVLPQAASDDDD